MFSSPNSAPRARTPRCQALFTFSSQSQLNSYPSRVVKNFTQIVEVQKFTPCVVKRALTSMCFGMLLFQHMLPWYSPPAGTKAHSDVRFWWSNCLVAALNSEVQSTKGSAILDVKVSVASSYHILSTDCSKLGASNYGSKSRRAIENNKFSRHIQREIV